MSALTLISVSSRLEAMQPSAIRDIHDLAVRLREQEPDREFITLHFGEPDLGTPDFIVEAACEGESTHGS